MTTCTNPQPLDFGASDPSTFKVCTFLVNVLSYMYEQWNNVKPKPHIPPAPFNWQPVNACPVTNNFKVTDYDFRPLIWSTFTYNGNTVTEPFGCVVLSKADGSFYLVFRGSKSDADFSVDDQTDMISYDAPTFDTPPPDLLVEQGWWSVYSGLLEGLRLQLKNIRGNSKLTITGHSLGSALATLAVPDAVANFLHVRHYNSASPMVGNESFRVYYESLKESTVGSVLETYRLVNTADTVPNFPPPKPPRPDYVHVGTAVSFNADYGEKLIPHQEKKTHNPCCSYAYAIYNPSSPCNRDYDGCAT